MMDAGEPSPHTDAHNETYYLDSDLLNVKSL